MSVMLEDKDKKSAPPELKARIESIFNNYLVKFGNYFEKLWFPLFKHLKENDVQFRDQEVREILKEVTGQFIRNVAMLKDIFKDKKSTPPERIALIESCLYDPNFAKDEDLYPDGKSSDYYKFNYVLKKSFTQLLEYLKEKNVQFTDQEVLEIVNKGLQVPIARYKAMIENAIKYDKSLSPALKVLLESVSKKTMK